MKDEEYKRKRRNLIKKEIDKSLLDKGKYLSVAFFVLAIIGFVLTIIIPVSPLSNMIVVYLRNYSSVALYLILGFYFSVWCSKNKYLTSKTMKLFKIFTLVTALACIAKAALTAAFFYRMSFDFNLVGIYYVGEAILWIGMSMFFVYYYKILRQC